MRFRAGSGAVGRRPGLAELRDLRREDQRARGAKSLRALREGEVAADFVSSAAACANAEAGQVSADGGADEAEMPRAESPAADELRDASSHEPEPIADSERG